MINQAVARSSIRRMRLIANKQTGLCSSFSSTSGTTTNNNSTKCNSKGDIRAVPFTSAVVSGNNPSWSDISVGRSSSMSSSNKTSGRNRKKNYISSRYVGKSSYSSNAGGNFHNDDRSSEPEFRSVYVHPLSQIVLEYLQNSHHDWIVSKGLDRSLTLHRDGSFEMKDVSQLFSANATSPFPPLANSTVEPVTPTSASHTAASNDETSTTTKASDGEMSSPSTSPQHRINTAVPADNNVMRIWTSYDEQEKKHWLTVRRGVFRQRFLLQDNLLTAWHGNRGVSLPERLQVAVDEMIRAIDRLDLQQKQEQQAAQTIRKQQWQQKGRRRFRKR